MCSYSIPHFHCFAFNWLNKPLAGSGHMVQKKLHWDANDAVGLPKQRNSYQSNPTSLCFEVPLRHLRPSVIYSVPCDRILQRAYSVQLQIFLAVYSGFQLTLAARIWKHLGILGTTFQNSRFHCYWSQSSCELWNENHEFDLEVRFEICEVRFQVLCLSGRSG